MHRLQSIAQRQNLFLIEDACEALGAEYRGKKIGAFGDVAVFAFYPNKQITTAEGGMVVTQNSELASRVRSLRNHGRSNSGRLASSTPKLVTTTAYRSCTLLSDWRKCGVSTQFSRVAAKSRSPTTNGFSLSPR